jgi:hypothetical protein
MAVVSIYMIVFRILHVMAAIAWGGAVFLMVVYVQPSVAAIAPAGAPFMREFLGRRRVVDGILGLAITTIVAGGFLYWHDWQLYGSLGDFLGEPFGLWLTIGMFFALAAFLIGLFVTRPTAGKLTALGAAVAQGGGTPTPEQGAQMQAFQARMKVAARVSLGLIAVAAFTMSTARYW